MLGWLVGQAFIWTQCLPWVSRGPRLNHVGMLPCLGPGAGACTENLTGYRSRSQHCSRLWWTLLSLLSTEPQQLLCRQKSRNLGRLKGCGFCSVACQVCPLAIALYPAEGAAGWGSPSSAEPLQGSASRTPITGPAHPPNPPLGTVAYRTVTYRICSILSSLVLWLLFEVCLKQIDARS